MIRRHRILELYLTQHLGYDWGGVHVEAERLEHAVSDELIERMASALGHPQYDPHGDPIPTAAGDIEEAELVALADARIGHQARAAAGGDAGCGAPALLRGAGAHPRRAAHRERSPAVQRSHDHRAGTSGDPRVVGRELAQLLLCQELGA